MYEAIGVLFSPGQVIELRIPTTRKNKTLIGFFDDHTKLAEAVQKYDGKLPGIYVTLNELKPELLGLADNRVGATHGSGAADVVKRRWLLLDFDPVRPVSGVSSTDTEHEHALKLREYVRDELAKLNWPAPVEADSGNGAHLLYHVDLPNDTGTTTLIKSALEALAERFDTKEVKIDRVVYDPSRISKLYGTWTKKGDPLPDRPHRRSQLLAVPKVIKVVKVEQLQALLVKKPNGKSKVRATATNAPDKFRQSKCEVEDLLNDNKYLKDQGITVLRSEVWTCQAGVGHRWILSHCPFNREHNRGEALVGVAPGGGKIFKCQHDSCKNYEWRDFWQKISSMQLYDKDDHLPIIRLTERVGDMVKIALKLLADHENVYDTEDNALVRIHPTDRVAELPPRREPLTADDIVAALSEVAHWTIVKRGKLHRVRPPKDLAHQVFSAIHEGIPKLNGFTDLPTVRKDGTLADEAGYDAATRLFYEPGSRLVSIPLKPTRDDAVKALVELYGVVEDVPFESSAQRAAWYASVLTLFARRIYTGPTPLFLFNANVRGAGKTLLATVALHIAFKDEICPQTWTRDEDEQKKMFVAALVQSDRAVFIDNVEGVFGGGTLNSFTTGHSWAGRILSVSRTKRTTQPPVLFVTGNNVILGGDTPRRIISIRIASPLERPEERDDFKHPDLMAWVAQERPRLAAAALTIIRAWFVAGQPQATLKAMGSFVGWNPIRHILMWLGQPDPLCSCESLQFVDTDADTAHGLVDGLAEITEDLGEAVSAADLRRMLEADFTDTKYKAFRDALMEKSPRNELPSAKSIGRILHHAMGRAAGGRCICARRDTHANVLRWYVGFVNTTTMSDVEFDATRRN